MIKYQILAPKIPRSVYKKCEINIKTSLYVSETSEIMSLLILLKKKIFDGLNQALYIEVDGKEAILL